MTTNEQTKTIAFTFEVLGGLVVRSVSLAAGMALAILLVAALFSASIPGTAAAAGDRVAFGKPVAPVAPVVYIAQDAPIIMR